MIAKINNHMQFVTKIFIVPYQVKIPFIFTAIFSIFLFCFITF